MITLLYCNINRISDNKIAAYFKVLPEFMRMEINRCVNIFDQKSKLLSRLMLLKNLENSEKIDFIYRWKRDYNNKPFIEGWNPFNISHSGEMVVFGYGNNSIGIDIEKNIKLNFEEIIKHFHPEEQEFISNSEQVQKTFYDIWVKKEAVLKAIGIGITNGLNEFSCVHESVIYRGNQWYFHSFLIHPDYIFYVCSLNKSDDIKATEFIPDLLFI